jgi:(2Fe-2S) ferredoxin
MNCVSSEHVSAELLRLRGQTMNKPKQNSYSKHIFICSGYYCDPNREATKLYNRLPKLLGEMGDYDNPNRIKRGLSPCLGVCVGGPLLVVYPEGTWYHNVDDQLLERIVDEHLRAGNPVEEAIFHNL